MPVLPTLTNDEIATYLTNGYWTDTGGIRHSFPVSPGGTLTIDMSTVAAAGRFLAERALEAWTMISGINFSVTNLVGADIVFTVSVGSTPHSLSRVDMRFRPFIDMKGVSLWKLRTSFSQEYRAVQMASDAGLLN